jgi:hypothetical protein
VEGTPTVLSRAALALAVAAPAAMDGHHPLSGRMATLWILFGCGTREEEEGQEKKEKGGRNLPRLRAGRRLSPTPAITGRREDETLRRLCVREARGKKKNGLGLLGSWPRGFCSSDGRGQPLDRHQRRWTAVIDRRLTGRI